MYKPITVLEAHPTCLEDFDTIEHMRRYNIDAVLG